jgi:hypothetical protein
MQLVQLNRREFITLLGGAAWLAEAGFSDICVQYGAAAGGASIVVARKKD